MSVPGTAAFTQPGTLSVATPYAVAVRPSSGPASRFPITSPARQPATAGIMAWLV